MNASIILAFAFVACAAAYVPSYNLDVSVSEGYGKIPYSSQYGLSQYYPYYQGLYSQSRYPYYQQQYGYGYPYSGLYKYLNNYLYGRQYPYYGYQSQSPISSNYGYPSYYPYYNYHQYQQIPYQYYGYQYPTVY